MQCEEEYGASHQREEEHLPTTLPLTHYRAHFTDRGLRHTYDTLRYIHLHTLYDNVLYCVTPPHLARAIALS
jgi:hypothetical protein